MYKECTPLFFKMYAGNYLKCATKLTSAKVQKVNDLENMLTKCFWKKFRNPWEKGTVNWVVKEWSLLFIVYTVPESMGGGSSEGDQRTQREERTENLLSSKGKSLSEIWYVRTLIGFVIDGQI